MLALLLAGCYQPPTETRLIRSFESNREAFDKLLTMAEADRKFHRIPAEGIPPIGMLVRDRQFGGPDRRKGPFHGLRIPARAPGDLVKRLPITESPFEIHSNSGPRTVFIPLDGRWYLFYASEW